jgi:outer membrane immunogenic protein
MRALLICLTLFGLGPAAAAELPVKAPGLYSPVPAANWTGFYVGVHAGGAWGYFRRSNLVIGPFGSDGGFIGGGQLGYNWQSGRWVFGVEGDISAIGIDADTATVGDFHENWTSTARVRVGYAIERYLAYLTGGVAFTGVETSLVGTPGSQSATVAGATVGFGVETMLTPNWTARVEALYIDVPKHRFLVGLVPVEAGSNNYTVRAGLNYLFH